MAEVSERTSVRHELTVKLPIEAAFARFVDDIDQWWPTEYTWSGDALEEIGIQARRGGMCFEVGPHGFRCDWGRVQRFVAPARIVISWQIGPGREPVPDPRRATEVELRFRSDQERVTEVALEHRHFERHGARGGAYLEAMASDAGWPHILGRYAEL